MGNFKYKIAEIKVGDVEIDRGTKYTVKSIDPESGAIEWTVEKTADYESSFETLHKAKIFLDQLLSAPGAKDDIKIRQIAAQVRDALNNYRSHLRKNYPEEYNKVKSLSEESTTGGGVGQAGFTSGTEGENYATKYAFRKKVKEDKGITPGPGPKAGPEGVTKNKYVTDYKYKLVDRKALNKAAKGIEVKSLWEADFDVNKLIKDQNITNPAMADWISKRVEAFDTLERQLNQLIPMLQQAKKETIRKYSQDPSFAVIYGTDLAQEYLQDIIELFKQPE
jgi:hypothetical protein